MNLNQEQFISDAPNPVSLFQITGKRYDRRVILEQFMERAEAYYERLKAGEDSLIASRYKEHLYRKDGFHAYRDGAGNFCARILDVEPDGRLILEDKEGNRRGYMFKEVEYVI